MNVRTTYTTTTTGGMKDELGKLDWTLVPWGEMKDVVAIMMHGARKYDAFNWKYVPKEAYIKAAIRHLIAIIDGETIDQESGYPHYHHVVCDMLYAAHNHRVDNEVNEAYNGPTFDDDDIAATAEGGQMQFDFGGDS